MEKYEVWLASVKFFDKPKRKNRPVIIYTINEETYGAIYLTTHEPRPTPGEYQLINFKEAGLWKPTVARCSIIVDLQEEEFICKFGTLSQLDIIGIELAIAHLPSTC